MIAELQFGTRLLRPTLSDAPVQAVTIEQLDATDNVPLQSVCWLEQESPDEFEAALADDRTVDDAVQLVATDHGCQYQITYSRAYPGTEVYSVAVDTNAVLISGRTDGNRWTLTYRFPDQSTFATFREKCAEHELDISVSAVRREESAPHAAHYDVSDPQREILMLATQRGYFEVPREASLADLADKLDVSSQAASERLRRGLDSLVEDALLTPE